MQPFVRVPGANDDVMGGMSCNSSRRVLRAFVCLQGAFENMENDCGKSLQIVTLPILVSFHRYKTTKPPQLHLPCYQPLCRRTGQF